PEYGIRARHVTGVRTCALPICSSDSTRPARAPRSCRPRAGAAAAALPPGEAGSEAGGSEADGRDATGCEADGWAAPDGRGASGFECMTEDSSGQGCDLDMIPRGWPAEAAAARPSVAR